ncbi:MAG TPA: WGR domain-containing protein, partial [Methylomirabilota bacterium]|nr:WGR domain-containing protein [Methylomirabilota bacterium]
MADVVKEDRYILSNISSNNNKWWDISLQDDDSVICGWGRVGEVGDQLTKRFTNTIAAGRFYDSKCREKHKKGYQPLRTMSTSGSVIRTTVNKDNLAEIATKQIEVSSPETVELIKYLTQANIHSILNSTNIQYDTSKGTFSTPLGVVTKEAIIEARDLLSNISTFIAAN